MPYIDRLRTFPALLATILICSLSVCHAEPKTEPNKRLIWQFSSELLQTQAKQGHDRSVVRLSGVASGHTNDPDSSIIEFQGEISSAPSIGTIRFRKAGKKKWNNFSWSFDPRDSWVALEQGDAQFFYRITPVTLDSSSFDDQFKDATTFKKLFPHDSDTAQIILTSDAIYNHLPPGIVRGLRLDALRDQLSATASSSSMVMQGTPQNWLCSLECGATLGTGALTVVSGGTLSPTLVLGAAA